MKKIIRKIKRKLITIDRDFKIKKLENLSLKKFSKITGMSIPKEFLKYKNIKIDNVSLSIAYLKPNSIFCPLYSYDMTEENIQKIKENSIFAIYTEEIPGCKTIIVNKLGEYGIKYFNYIRNAYNPKVITVTGSVGKTSTKEMIGAVLEQKYGDRLLASRGNSNSFNKVMEYIKCLSKDVDIYLQEVGAGSMAYDIVKNPAMMLEADICVYTNIRDSHIEWYGSRENIAKEKFSLSDYGKKKGVAIINYDDEILINHQFAQKTISYSLNNSSADVYAKNIKITSDGTSFVIVDNIRKKSFKIELGVIGEQHVLNSLVAYIVGKELKLKFDLIKRGLKNYKTTGSRQNLIDVGKYKILADCYNSSYDALSFILRTFDIMKVKNSGRKIAVIGDIFELGKISDKIHKNVGELLASYELDKVFFYGEKTRYSYEIYNSKKNNSIYCKTRNELLENIKNEIKENDIILFKASHGMYFAEVIDKLFGTEIGEMSFIGHKEYELFEDKDFIYNIYKNHISIRKYGGNNKKIVIKDIINGLKVEMLGKAAFINGMLEEIKLPKHLVRVRSICFKNSKLKKIKFNNELKSIGESAFRFCNELEEVILPEGLLFIEYRAFADCNKLKKVYIPSSVTKMAFQVFHNSKNVIIYCHRGSFAERYAKKRDIKCCYVD